MGRTRGTGRRLTTWEQAQRQILRERAVFYRRLNAEARPVFDRLERAYQGRAVAIAAKLEALAGTTSSSRQEAALNRLLGQVEGELRAMSGDLGKEIQGLRDIGVRGGGLFGVSALREGGVTAMFNQPLLQAVRAAVNYADSAEMSAILNNYAPYHVGEVRDLIISGFAQGKNPREVARLAREYFTGSQRPLTDALRLSRTTMLYSAREGTRTVYERYGIEYWIWASALDLRTCMSCIAQHGTRHPVDEILNDHHQGRCAPVPVTQTWASMGIEGGQELEPITGEAWFRRQPESVQRAMMGAGKFDAWKAGKFEIGDMSTTYYNPLFGTMRREATLKELLVGRGGPTPVPPPTPPVISPVAPPTVVSPPSLVDEVVGEKSVGDMLLPEKGTGALQKAIRPGIDAIDNVHTVDDLPDIILKVNRSAGSEGYFQPAERFGRVNGEYRGISAIAGKATASDPAGTFVHEFGHNLDWNGFVDDLAEIPGKRRFATEVAAEFDDGPMLGWWKAVQETDEYKLQEYILAHPDEVLYRTTVDGVTYKNLPNVEFLKYAHDPVELWARSYAQYIGQENGYGSSYNYEGEAGPYGLVWSDANFGPVREAIDAILRAKGWKK